MEDSAFRGAAGETVYRFVRLSTLLTIIPTLIVSALLAVGTAYLAEKLKLPTLFILPAMTIALSPLLGLFALGARDGNLEAGILSSPGTDALLSFIGRYSALTLAWQIPWLLAMWQLLKTGISPQTLLAVSSGKIALLAVLLMILLVVGAFAAPATLIIAIGTTSLLESFSKEVWHYVFVTRFADWVPFFAAFAGGMVLFFAMNVPIMMLISWWAVSGTSRIALLISGTVYAFPAAGVPILLGRLAGSFVASHTYVAVPHTTVIPHKATPAAAVSPTPVKTERKAADPIQLVRVVQGLVARAETDLDGAIVEVELLRASYPTHIAVAGELSKLYRKAGRDADALTTASTALQLALKNAANPVAIELYQTFSDQRKELKLEASSYEQLARILLNQRKFDDAIWAFRAAEVAGADTARVQKGIIGAAEMVSRAHEHHNALAIYRYFVKTYPTSTFVGYCNGEIERLQRRVGPAL